MRLILALLGALDLGDTAELLGAVLPLLACKPDKLVLILGVMMLVVVVVIGRNIRCWREAFSILEAAPMRTRR